ncbi:MAG TPA: tRNA epoxyqueuosine(34) reductase QueG [Gammaproteobacteria bacterium]|jgi:epoxyqueuosine reductase
MKTLPQPASPFSSEQLETLAGEIKELGATLGFQQLGITDTDLSEANTRLKAWLDTGRHGEMAYMTFHGEKRAQASALLPNAARIISARMDYWPEDDSKARAALEDDKRAYVSRYALGRDYHKVLRQRLHRLARAIEQRIGPFGYRVCVDSAPVLEKAVAQKAGLGWIGKHTNLINRGAGSWFFLGEILTDLPLPTDAAATDHCGTCRACLDVCPTQAIVAPYELDARRCISYLTIELRGPIPEELRPGIGNRIFGCDDCQLFCPWNKFARLTRESDFKPRHGLDTAGLLELFAWSEADWSHATEGSALRRAGYEGWLRNLAVALGNAPQDPRIVAALEARAGGASDLVREHIDWALTRQRAGRA